MQQRHARPGILHFLVGIHLVGEPEDFLVSLFRLVQLAESPLDLGQIDEIFERRSVDSVIDNPELSRLFAAEISPRRSSANPARRSVWATSSVSPAAAAISRASSNLDSARTSPVSRAIRPSTIVADDSM